MTTVYSYTCNNSRTVSNNNNNMWPVVEIQHYYLNQFHLKMMMTLINLLNEDIYILRMIDKRIAMYLFFFLFFLSTRFIPHELIKLFVFVSFFCIIALCVQFFTLFLLIKLLKLLKLWLAKNLRLANWNLKNWFLYNRFVHCYS